METIITDLKINEIKLKNTIEGLEALGLSAYWQKQALKRIRSAITQVSKAERELNRK